MAKPLELNNGRSWKTRKAALDYFREMLARYSNDETVNESDQNDLTALLAHYDRDVPAGSPTKTGVGISHFKRQSNADLGWPTDGFRAYRNNNTSIDFSYIHAVNS